MKPEPFGKEDLEDVEELKQKLHNLSINEMWDLLDKEFPEDKYEYD